MEKSPDTFAVRHFDIGARVGRFYEMLDRENLIAKSGSGFTFHHPYGIISIKPDADSIRRFLGMAFQLNVANGNDESILNCTADIDAVNAGKMVTWESERYSKKSPKKITLSDWLQKQGMSYEAPKRFQDGFGIIEGGRGNIEAALARTGTFEGL